MTEMNNNNEEMEQIMERPPSPSTPSSPKSLASLTKEKEDAEDESRERSSYEEIYHALALSGDEEERINLTKFRRIIADNLDIDPSFMFKRVFNAFDRKRNGYLTAKELVSAISVLLQGPFQEQVDLGLRVYGKPSSNVADDTAEKNNSEMEEQANDGRLPPSTSDFTITRVDAILSIVESLQLSSPRARYTLTTDNREKAYHIGEDLVFIIYPKLDIDGDGVISLDDFSQACHEDPSLIQVFGQYLPKNNGVLPTSKSAQQLQSISAEKADTSCDNNCVAIKESASGERIRPRSSSSRSSFEGIDYLRHSPTIGTMWGRQETLTNDAETMGEAAKSERLEPIPVVKRK